MAHADRDYQYPVQWIGGGEMPEWIASERFHAGIYDANSGHLHPLKYCLGLAAAARRAGVRIFEKSAAYLLERGVRPVVKTAIGDVICDFVVLAGNVYLSDYTDGLAPEIQSRILPVGTYMIATESLGPERAAQLMPRRPAVSDNNYLLDYFRLSADHRVIFGASESYTGLKPRNLAGRLRKRMLAVFPQIDDVIISHAWGGFVDVTMNKAPHFGRLGHNIYFLQGFSDHGVAMAGMAGQLVAEAIAGQAERFDLFTKLRHLPFPV
ncbi:Gamma-glutamylputrescine oxidoreductase, putative, partial [Ricinus communis]